MRHQQAKRQAKRAKAETQRLARVAAEGAARFAAAPGAEIERLIAGAGEWHEEEKRALEANAEGWIEVLEDAGDSDTAAKIRRELKEELWMTANHALSAASHLRTVAEHIARSGVGSRELGAAIATWWEIAFQRYECHKARLRERLDADATDSDDDWGPIIATLDDLELEMRGEMFALSDPEAADDLLEQLAQPGAREELVADYDECLMQERVDLLEAQMHWDFEASQELGQ